MTLSLIARQIIDDDPPAGLEPEVALLETDGTAYLTRSDARHLAVTLLSWSGEDE